MRIRIHLLKTASVKQVASWLLAGLPLGTVAAWLLLGNLACLTWDTFWAFSIQFDPPFFMMEGGKKGAVEAELSWSDTKTLEAKTWTVETRPTVLAAASCSPSTESDSTTISLECGSDPSLFGPSELWTASTSGSYQLGIKATFVDPVWKSVSGGQEVVLARRAYLPLRGGQSQFAVKMTEKGRDSAQFTVNVLNPFEGWSYFCEGHYNYAEGDDFSKGGGGSFFKTQLDSLSHYERAYYPGYPGERVLVVFELSQKDHTGRLVRTEQKSFRFRN